MSQKTAKRQNKLRQKMRAQGISQTELAYKVGVTQRYIAFLETGDRMPSLETAQKIARVLKTSTDSIFLP